MYRRYLIYIFLFQSIISLGQTLRFKHITSEEGLPTNYVTSIISDNKGFMWFGTQEGLCRYNGYSIEVFKHNKNNGNTLSSSNVISLYNHSDNKIYVGTRNAGLSIFDPVKNSYEVVTSHGSKSEALTDSKVTCMIKEDEENIWVGTGNGLNLLNTKTHRIKQLLFPLTDPVSVLCLYKFKDKVIIGTGEKGLWEVGKNFQLKQFELYNDYFPKVNVSTASNITDIDEYAGKLYASTQGEGIVMFDPQEGEIEKVIQVSNNRTNYVLTLEIRDNKIYSGTKSGFIIYNLLTGSEEVIMNDGDKKSLNDDQINTVFMDTQGNIWLGTFSGGVNISFSQAKKFPNLPSAISNLFKQTYSIHEDKDNFLWVGGEKKLIAYNRFTGEIKDHSNVVGNNTVLALTSDKAGNIWIGTWGSGIIKFNRKTGAKESVLKKEGKTGTILFLTQVPNGDIWAGSYEEGLFVCENKTGIIHNYTQREGLSSNNITSVLVDKNNNYWVGTDGGGVNLIKDGNIIKGPVKIFVLSDSSNSISSNTIYSLTEDARKNIWFATDFGISKYEPSASKFTNFTEEDGLGNNFTYSVMEDSAQCLWISTNKGITKFNPLITNVNGSAFKNYDQKDGLLNNEYTQNAFCKCSNGEFVFGSTNGINIFNPRKILNNFRVPPVYVVGFTRSGNTINIDTAITFKKYIELNWRENFFQFELAALDYNDPIKNKYIYKLENYDKDWSTPTNVRYVSYTELPGGDYVFKVKASNNDGIWNDVPFEIRIKVVPPFWKTVWFYVVVSVIGIIGIVGFTQYRTRAIKRENKILEQKVEERTKELAEKNRDITSSIEYAKRIQEAILPSKELIYDSLKNAFILYKPKDIVSGDFYWFGIKNGYKIMAVVDCTGHGVPGAFMSMIGHNLLNQIVQEKAITDPGEILNNLHKGIQEALKQGQNQVNTNDGMDVSLVAIHHEKNEVKWAGAFRPLVIIRANGTLEKLDGNKFPVGGAQLNVDRVFTTHTISVSKNDSIYMSSDGYADQFGGEKGKKFMVKKFNEILCNIHLQDMNGQKNRLENEIEQWRGHHEQVDDVLVAGIRF